MEPTSENILFPETCSRGCSSFDPKSIKPFYTHQVIELPEIKMDVLHFILNQGKCTQCGNVVKAQLPKERQAGYGPRISALIAEVNYIDETSWLQHGALNWLWVMVNNTCILHDSQKPIKSGLPGTDSGLGRDFYQRFMDFIKITY